MRNLRALIATILVFGCFSIAPSQANQELSIVQNFPAIAESNVSRVTAEFSLPLNVVLGSKSKVVWGYKEPTFKNEFGDEYTPESGIFKWMSAFEIQMEAVGRKAKFTVYSALAVEAQIQVFATVDGKTYQSTSSVRFLQAKSEAASRDNLPRLPQDFKIEIENPNPGLDLQTVVRARVTGTGEWPTRDFYLYNSVANGGKDVSPNEWASWEISAEKYKEKGMYIQASWRVPVGIQYSNSTMNLAPIFSRRIPVIVDFPAIPISEDNTTIDFQCSYIKSKSNFNCTVGMKTSATGGLPAAIIVQTRVDGKPWGNKKKIAVSPGKEVKITMPNLTGRDQDLQAIYSNNGTLIESDMSSWTTNSASSAKPFSESVLRAALKKNCSNLPSRFNSYKFSQKGTTFNAYGQPLTIYGLQLLRVTVFNGDSNWQIGGYSADDTMILDLWECSSPLKINK